MSEEVNRSLMNIEGVENVEDSFLDDDEDDPACNSTQNLYSFYSFPKEEPTSVRFKGKKAVFVQSVQSLNDLLKRGDEISVNNVLFKVMDTRKMPHGTEYDIESTKNKDKGISVLKVYGPNQKKGCTVMICKSREYDNKFVSTLAIDIIKYLLDNFEVTDGWKDISRVSNVKKPSCKLCKKSFCNERNLKVHMKKFHTNSNIIKCGICDITVRNGDELKVHNENNHQVQIADKEDDDHKMDIDSNDKNQNSEEESDNVKLLKD